MKSFRHFKRLADFILGPEASADAPAESCVEVPDRLSEDKMNRIHTVVKPLTMVPEPAVRFVAEQAVELVAREVPGIFVECGVWRGGCSIAMLLAQQEQFGRVMRPVYMLDSFEGLPPVTERDGPLARQWQNGADPGTFLDNCKTSVEDLQSTLDNFGFHDDDYKIIPGWFNKTLPELVEAVKNRSIALLRLDCDWYDSTRSCLEHLVTLVPEGGLIIVDDYYAWDGCARAVHDYLSRHDLSYRIRSLPNWYGAYFIKQQHRQRCDVL